LKVTQRILLESSGPSAVDDMLDFEPEDELSIHDLPLQLQCAFLWLFLYLIIYFKYSQPRLLYPKDLIDHGPWRIFLGKRASVSLRELSGGDPATLELVWKKFWYPRIP
jgi:hypothetical protein